MSINDPGILGDDILLNRTLSRHFPRRWRLRAASFRPSKSPVDSTKVCETLPEKNFNLDLDTIRRCKLRAFAVRLSLQVTGDCEGSKKIDFFARVRTFSAKRAVFLRRYFSYRGAVDAWSNARSGGCSTYRAGACSAGAKHARTAAKKRWGDVPFSKLFLRRGSRKNSVASVRFGGPKPPE